MEFVRELLNDTAGRFILALIAVVIGLLCLMVYAGTQEAERTNKLMQECMDDGNKEYQCEAMLKRGSRAPIVVPMTVPVR